MIFYNLYFIHSFKIDINIEIFSLVWVIEYNYKLIYKGFDYITTQVDIEKYEVI